MEINSVNVEGLVNNPRESLAVEIKDWIDPGAPHGQKKIVQTCLALRNHGGGYMLIGFHDETLQPNIGGAPSDVRERFHSDIIQALVSRFASTPFEVTVEFVSREGKEFPVLIVPTGVTTPVASKSDLYDGRDKLIRADDVYVRTLNANNTPSSARATWKDWTGIVDVSFDNREADIGRFLRRHLSGISAEHLRTLFELASEQLKPSITIDDQLTNLINSGNERFQKIVSGRQLTLPTTGYWEAGLILDGNVPPFTADRPFLNLLDASNPELTGWPMWLNTTNFADARSRPFVDEGCWESLIFNLQGAFHHIDFNQFDPKGRFYYLSAFPDDISTADNRPEALTAFDSSFPVFHCAEAIVIGLAFAKAMGCSPDDCTLQFAFRWTGLRNRRLSAWANPGRLPFFGQNAAYQNELTVYQNVPLDTPNSAIAGLLAPTLAPLYALFDGFKLSAANVEKLVGDLLNRRW